MISRAPYFYERTPNNDDAELRGSFCVMHAEGPVPFNSTYDRPQFAPLSLCGERPLRWLWQDRIPLGKLTLIEGPPAVGKLFVALDIATRVSNGDAARERSESRGESRAREGDTVGDVVEPSESAAGPAGPEIMADSVPQNGKRHHSATRPPLPPLPQGGSDGPAATECGAPVVVLCDSWQAQDMIAPRLRKLGADPQRVVTFTHVSCTDTCQGHKHSRSIRLPLDTRMFEYILLKHRGCRLIVIDDLEQYCESPQELRRAIRVLDEVAIYHDVAIVATLQGNVRFAADGTIRDAARADDRQARCIWCVTPDPAHPGLLRLEPKRMAFCKQPEGIAFRISDAGKIVWEPLPLYEKPPTEAARRKKQEHARMLTWLTDTLGTGVVPAETIYDAGREQGFSKNKLIAAREEIGARTFKHGFGDDGAWMWTRKPDSEVTDAEVEAAYLDLADGARADAHHAPPVSRGEKTGAAKLVAEGPSSPLRNHENFGVLSEKVGKSAGTHVSRAGRKPSNVFDGLDLSQLPDLALKRSGLLRPTEPAAYDAAGEHVGNGHAGNGKPRNGYDRNGRLD